MTFDNAILRELTVGIDVAGYLRIMELRHKAERELGPKFDIRAYHDMIVGHGALPLNLLERQTDGWIAAQKRQ